MPDNPFKQWWRNYLSFSKKDRSAIITLGVLILFILIGHIIVNNIHPKSQLDHERARQVLNEWQKLRENNSDRNALFSFNPNTISQEKLDSLLLPEFIKRNILSYRDVGGKFSAASDVRKIYGMNDSIFAAIENYITIPRQQNDSQKVNKVRNTNKTPRKLTGYFDPNTAERDTLLNFGFNNYQAGNLIKYRNNGGSFRQASDILKIYGIDSVFYRSVKKHIQIKPDEKSKQIVEETSQISIELNSATPGKLEKLNGVGPVFASRIVKYRNLLGGFYSKKQLLEVYNLPAETFENIESSVYVDTTKINRIRLNFVEYSDLLRHPYLEKEEVEKILDHRQTNGPFKSEEELMNAGLVTKAKFEKIKHYLSCR